MMGLVKSPQPTKLIVGIIIGAQEPIEDVKEHLEVHFGVMDLQSNTIPFTHTSYYASEMGSKLWRFWFSHKKLIPPGDIVKIKLRTNEIELFLAADGKRRVNLDPGYLSLSKLVLATTKDAAHRIYLNDGIYGEVTLSYVNHSWISFNWTYPDYREKIALDFFDEVRKRYLKQLKGDL